MERPSREPPPYELFLMRNSKQRTRQSEAAPTSRAPKRAFGQESSGNSRESKSKKLKPTRPVQTTECISLLSSDEEDNRSGSGSSRPTKAGKRSHDLGNAAVTVPGAYFGSLPRMTHLGIINQPIGSLNTLQAPPPPAFQASIPGPIIQPGQQVRSPYWIPQPALLDPASNSGLVPAEGALDEALRPPRDPQQLASAANPDGPRLCQEQAELVDLILSGKNVFYTGSAGCGKSTVLKEFVSRMRDVGRHVDIVAPTGRAALEVGGRTTWTYAGMNPSSHKLPLEKLVQIAHRTTDWKRLRQTDVLVIDEISMVSNHHLERINLIMKEARRTSQDRDPGPFGGVQVVVTGDFCQLPPVKPFDYCIECGTEMYSNMSLGTSRCRKKCKHSREYQETDKWAFKSDAWQECNFHHVHLKTIHRQNDVEFIQILQKLRVGTPLSMAEINRLMDHPCDVSGAVRLFSLRQEVRRVNDAEFNKLKSPPSSFKCLDTFNWDPDRHPLLKWKGGREPDGSLSNLKEHRYEPLVELKKGMLVVLLMNLDLEAKLCNGSQGRIIGFEPFDPKKLPKASLGNINNNKKEDDQSAKLRGDHASIREWEIQAFIKAAEKKHWPIVRFHSGVTRTIYADCSVHELGDDEPYSLQCRTQIPLAPAWAMSIHKSQSLTLDRVIVDPSRAFEAGQPYVALSRARSLQGLKVVGDPKGLRVGDGGNPEVREFLKDKFGL